MKEAAEGTKERMRSRSGGRRAVIWRRKWQVSPRSWWMMSCRLW